MTEIKVPSYLKLPPYCHLSARLPNGFRKRDGVPFKDDSHGRYKGAIVECGDDLYINHVVYRNWNEEIWLVIENYRNIPLRKWISDIEECSNNSTAVIEGSVKDALFKFYRDRGMSIGLTYPIFR